MVVMFSFNLPEAVSVSFEPQLYLKESVGPFLSSLLNKLYKQGTRKEWAQQSDRNAAGIPRNQASSPRPRLHFPPSLFTNPYGVLMCCTMDKGAIL